MNRLEELLIILQEECGEVSQCASKCIRFGLDTIYSDKSNRIRLQEELGDLIAMIKLISEETNLDIEHILQSAESKLTRVERYMRNGVQQSKKTKKKAKKPTHISA